MLKYKKFRELLFVIAIVSVCVVVIHLIDNRQLGEFISPDEKITVTVHQDGKNNIRVDSQGDADLQGNILNIQCKDFDSVYFSPSSRFAIVKVTTESGKNQEIYFDYQKGEIGGFGVDTIALADKNFMPQWREPFIYHYADFEFIAWHPTDDLIMYSYTAFTIDDQQQSGFLWFDPNNSCIMAVDEQL